MYLFNSLEPSAFNLESLLESMEEEMASYCNDTTLGKYPTETWNYILGSIMGVISFLAVFENLTLLCVFVRNPSIRTQSNKIIMSLVVADFLTGLTVSPLYTAKLFYGVLAYDCNAQTARRLLATIFLGASMSTVGFVSADRAHHLIKLQNYRIENGLLYKIIGLCWGIPIVIVAIGLLTNDKIYAASIFIFLIVLITIVLGSYMTLLSAIRKHQGKTTISPYLKNQIAAAKTAIMIVTFYIFMILPLLIEKIMYASKFEYDDQFDRPILLIFGVMLCAANSVVNPFIYCARIPTIRKYVMKLRFDDVVSPVSPKSRNAAAITNIQKSTRL